MNDYRDDETEPMTRLLGVVVREPREGEPQKRLADVRERKPAELTRLEIARPRTVSTYASSEPATQIVTPDRMRPPLSLSTATLPRPVPRPPTEDIPTPTPPEPFGSDRESPALPIKPVFAPRLSQADKHEITASRKTPQRAMPILLGIALVMFVVTGASLFRDRARAAKRASAAAQVETHRTKAPAPVRTASSTPLTAAAPATAAEPARATTPSPAPAPAPELESPSPPPAVAPAKLGGSAPLDVSTFADLEKRAVDRLRDNDHVAALALYTELARVEPKNPAFPVMVSLLTRRVRACQGDPSCAR